MDNRTETLARVYALILNPEWGCSNPHKNQNAPDDAANDNQGQNGKEMNISFRSLPKIIHDAAGEDISSETE